MKKIYSTTQVSLFFNISYFIVSHLIILVCIFVFNSTFIFIFLL